MTKEDMHDLLSLTVKRTASDLHLKAGRPPLLRVGGDVVPTERSPLSAEEVRDLCFSIMPPEQTERFKVRHEIDFGYSLPGVARFRINVFQQQGLMGMAVRNIPFHPPDIDTLGLPAVVKEIAERPNGMVLVTGPSGSGKSTTVAGIVEYVNRRRYRHVVTIEDPIEFVFEDKKALINQREIGFDTSNFVDALKYALRQDPDIVVVGEMRDRETIETAVHAAETGHLLFSTLHTNDAAQSVNRIIDMFPAEQQQQIRIQLGAMLQCIISQRLVRRLDGKGMALACEVMVQSPRIRELIIDGKIKEITHTIEGSTELYHMQSLNQSLADLIRDGVVSEDDAMLVSTDTSSLRMNLQGIVRGAGR